MPWNNDHKFFRIAAQDRLSIDENHRSLPYCMVNANRFDYPVGKLENFLHEVNLNYRINEEDSLQEFVARLDIDKLLWRVSRRNYEIKPMQKTLHLDTSTNTVMVNTGINNDLIVGDKIFALPGISYLAKNNPSVNTFVMNGRTFMHPMIINWQEKSMLQSDVIELDANPYKATPNTMIGRMLQKYINKSESIDLNKLLSYLPRMKPIGTIMASLAGERRSLYDVAQTTVPLGAEFICSNWPF
ncbi:hypothetical protein RRG08_010277 [Elysia crispata]|uniref:Uncharacterized protein n=1 Tax=Elysia crispata TaxID=231223 RepID=A0AAE0Z2F5_9GAST|nr:hypothetical protein RRG08_010277 [Elysia crispata]